MDKKKNLRKRGAERIRWREHLVTVHGWWRDEADRWNINTLRDEHFRRYDCSWEDQNGKV